MKSYDRRHDYSYHPMVRWLITTSLTVLFLLLLVAAMAMDDPAKAVWP